MPFLRAEVLDWLLNLGLLVLILGSSWLVTNLYCRMAYFKCPACGALNAKRRSRCRLCAEEAPEPSREARR